MLTMKTITLLQVSNEFGSECLLNQDKKETWEDISCSLSQEKYQFLQGYNVCVGIKFLNHVLK